MRTEQEVLTKAAQMIRDRGWFRVIEHGRATESNNPDGKNGTVCAQIAISRTTEAEDTSIDDSYARAMTELSRRIKAAHPYFTMDTPFRVVTEFNDSQETPDALLALMEGTQSDA